MFTGLKGAPLRRAGFRRSYRRPATRKAELEGLKVHELRHTPLWPLGDCRCQLEGGVHPSGSLVSCVDLDRYGHLYEVAGADVPDRLDALGVPA